VVGTWLGSTSWPRWSRRRWWPSTEKVKDTKYKRGETIYLPGDPSDAVYFVKKGRVKLSHRDKSGKSLTIRMCYPEEPFGEMAAMGDELRPLPATALNDIWLCWVGRERFARFAETHPQITLRRLMRDLPCLQRQVSPREIDLQVAFVVL